MVVADEYPPALAKFLKSVTSVKADDATEILTGLLKRREIKSSRNVAKAVTKLLLRFVSQNRHTKLSESQGLIKDVKDLGKTIIAAQPRELVIGNIVRRVLGIIREECHDSNPLLGFADLPLGGRLSRASSIGDESADLGSNPGSGTATPYSGRPFSRDGGEEDIDAMSRRKSKAYIPPNPRDLTRQGSIALPNPNFGENNLQHALFFLLRLQPEELPNDSPGLKPQSKEPFQDKDIRGDVIEGIKELMDELELVDEQVAAHSETHIHANEIVMVLGSSPTLQTFLMKAAVKRKFTVVMIEAYPNDSRATQDVLKAPSKFTTPTGLKQMGKNAAKDEPLTTAEMKATLTSVGVETILIPDSAVPAVMSRVNKVLMGTHVILRNGSMITTAGARTVARCAQEHSIPVVVVSGVYKLSPLYPFDPDSMLETGESSTVIGWADSEMVGNAEIINPTMDFVPGELVDHYITNVGGYTPQNLYKLVEEQYGNANDTLE
ncbi:Translation initiation factor eIF-2B subunit beta [Orbilia oligospora]|uniref:Translation initiation factor eIF2B subunit beta n=1 Tax=Orbilia oligospora TaxID=2813651 RepID=A0A8H2DUG7_ORBOL|nr:Translation initiation factor eIF-2B subunit beta [Orbilia oligospora]KAF3285096.1 Translation initiation factor eIF-2B subunit beta [Orbilia oligospora]TGJ65142.1 Translation initiation factor eIF-2B subunit beta [Orbilia oligospora]